jgi:hypothetical protein
MNKISRILILLLSFPIFFLGNAYSNDIKLLRLYSTPLLTASVTQNAYSYVTIGTNLAPKAKKGEDTSTKVTYPKNKIRKMWVGNDGVLNLDVELLDACSEIKITIFNMFGKAVHKVYKGLPKNENKDGFYSFQSSTPIKLPKSVYIVVVQGNTFKLAEKLVISN